MLVSADAAPLSVIIPAYNAAATLAAAIGSAWSAGASQVIVVDDGSDDATGNIAAQLGAEVLVQSNSGAAAARRAGLAIASQTQVVFLDADDSLIADGIGRSLEIAAAVEAPSIVAGAFVGVDLNGSGVAFATWDRDITPWELIRRQHAPGPPGTFLWPRGVLASALLSDQPVPLWPRYAEDFELLLRGAMLCPIVQHDLPVLRYALAGGKSSTLPTNSVRAGADIAAHYARVLGVPFRPPSQRQLEGRAMVRAAMTARAGGRRMSWWAQIIGAFSRDPGFVSRAFGRKAQSRWRRMSSG